MMRIGPAELMQNLALPAARHRQFEHELVLKALGGAVRAKRAADLRGAVRALAKACDDLEIPIAGLSVHRLHDVIFEVIGDRVDRHLAMRPGARDAASQWPFPGSASSAIR